jgi:phosphoenolpyruvate carboxykinase (GTP)
VWTVGDDIAWMHVGEDGRLWAINPEAGFFGVAPGTSLRTNPNALASLSKNTIFTNVALKPDGTVWWEGKGGEVPDGTIDWKGAPYHAGNGDAAHPNSRFTVPAAQCPNISPKFDEAKGVPIDVIVFGGRRDPMAMKPFCGYNMAHYFSHWLAMGEKLTHPPKIFHVNWFRKDADGKFIWPGYGENLRVLRWMRARVRGEAGAVETPIGFVPTPGAIDTTGLENVDMASLLSVDEAEWKKEIDSQKAFFSEFGDDLPRTIWHELGRVEKNLDAHPAK